MIRAIAASALTFTLLGCAGESYDDLQGFMREAEKNSPRKIEPLPEVKVYVPFEYAGFDLPEPFKPRKLEPAKGDNGLQPDLNRRREPLELYPLESLKMVGTLQQGKSMFALVKAENTIYRVRPGNYLGQNFGLITTVRDTDVKLKEIVQDAAGDWNERESALQLLDESEKK